MGDAIVGVVANPLSGRDIRRLVTQASVFPMSEKASMIQRMLTAFGAVGVHRVLLSTDLGGISAAVFRAIGRHRDTGGSRPDVEFCDGMPIRQNAQDLRGGRWWARALRSSSAWAATAPRGSRPDAGRNAARRRSEAHRRGQPARGTWRIGPGQGDLGRAGSDHPGRAGRLGAGGGDAGGDRRRPGTWCTWRGRRRCSPRFGPRFRRRWPEPWPRRSAASPRVRTRSCSG